MINAQETPPLCLFKSIKAHYRAGGQGGILFDFDPPNFREDIPQKIRDIISI